MTRFLSLAPKHSAAWPGLLAAFFVALLTVGVGNTALAAEEKAKVMDPKAIEILDRMSAYLGKAKALSFTAITSFDDLETGVKTKVFRRTKIYLSRPTGIYAEEVTDDGSGRKVWFDGKTLTQFLEVSKKYQELPFKGTNDAAMDELVDKYDARFSLGDLLYTDSAKNFKEHLLSAEYLGRKRVGGVAAHHLSFESAGADFQLWVQDGAIPVPLRYVITHAVIKTEPEFMSRLTNWMIDGPMDDEMFRAIIPAGTKKKKFAVNADIKK